MPDLPEQTKPPGPLILSYAAPTRSTPAVLRIFTIICNAALLLASISSIGLLLPFSERAYGQWILLPPLLAAVGSILAFFPRRFIRLWGIVVLFLAAGVLFFAGMRMVFAIPPVGNFDAASGCTWLLGLWCLVCALLTTILHVRLVRFHAAGQERIQTCA